MHKELFKNCHRRGEDLELLKQRVGDSKERLQQAVNVAQASIYLAAFAEAGYLSGGPSLNIKRAQLAIEYGASQGIYPIHDDSLKEAARFFNAYNTRDIDLGQTQDNEWRMTSDDLS